MDENVKPGDGKKRAEEKEPAYISPACFAAKRIGQYFLFILALPLLIIFYMPVLFGIDLAKKCH